MYNLNNENNQIFISSIIIAILFFMFVMPAIESCYTQEKKNFFNRQITDIVAHQIGRIEPPYPHIRIIKIPYNKHYGHSQDRRY